MSGYGIAEKIRNAALAYGRIDVNRAYLELSGGSPTVALRSELRSSGIEVRITARLVSLPRLTSLAISSWTALITEAKM